MHELLVYEATCSVDVREVEDFDFRRNREIKHVSREIGDERRGIVIDDGREIDRARRQRGHIGAQVECASPGGRISTSTPRRELYYHAWAVPPHAFLHDRKSMRVRRRRFVIIPNMNMDQ